MKSMRFELSDIVKATPQQTFAWWTDFEEGDAGRVMPPLRERRIVRHTATETETEDRWSVSGIPMRTRAILKPRPPDRWEVIFRLRGGWARDAVRLESVPGGARVSMDMEMHLRWPWTWAARVLRRWLERLFLEDLRAVNRRLEASLASEKGPP